MIIVTAEQYDRCRWYYETVQEDILILYNN